MMRTCLWLLVVGCVGCVACTAARPVAPPTVVFVCEHGSAKSVIAAALFEKRARERGLQARVVARGITPDEEIPARVRDGLAGDGLAPLQATPVRADLGELSGATRVIAFSPLPPELSGAAPTEVWGEVPPVSSGYQPARDAMLRRVDALLDTLMAPRRRRPGS